jgi:membrane associated rhomboid family serine protease
MIWLGTNYLFGSGMVDITGEGMKIAWQAHVGGFVAGFFMISLFKTNNHE